MIGHAKKIVLLGMMTKMPVAGVVWQTLHYLRRLRSGSATTSYYVEAHGRTPAMLMRARDDDGSARRRGVHRPTCCARFGLGDRWAYHAAARRRPRATA